MIIRVIRGKKEKSVSGSGNSPNIVEGVRVAKALGAKVVGMLGFDGGKVRGMADVVVESNEYEYISPQILRRYNTGAWG